jgi:hypothetical protein
MTTRFLGTEGFSWFFGVVEDREDPLQLGRVRVRVHNFHEDDELIPKDTLHWSSIIMPPTSASASNLGTSPTGIAVGSTVFGFFVDGAEKQKPVVLGTMHGIPETNKHDVSQLVRANGDGKGGIQKETVGPEPASAFSALYPYNKTITTESGHAIELDDTPGHERMHVYHKSGTYIEINNEGRKVTKVVSDDIEVVIKDKTVYVAGNVTLTVQGNLTATVSGKTTVSGSDNIDVNSTTKIALTAPLVSINGS